MPDKPRRFVLLKHSLPGEKTHFDFLLEQTETCLAFRLQEDIFKTLKSPGEQIKPHRKHYLNFEGKVSNNRGFVVRVAEGVYTSLDSALGLKNWHLALENTDGVFSIHELGDNKIDAQWRPAQA